MPIYIGDISFFQIFNIYRCTNQGFAGFFFRNLSIDHDDVLLAVLVGLSNRYRFNNARGPAPCIQPFGGCEFFTLSTFIGLIDPGSFM